MAVAIRLGKTRVMDYNYKHLDIDSWIGYRAWKVWSARPKWSSFETSSDSIDVPSEQGDARSNAVSHEQQSAENSGADSGEVGNGNVNSRVTTSNGAGTEDRYKIGSRNAKIVRQEELCTNAVRSMAQSAKRKSTTLEETIAIAAFSRPEAADLQESAAFFELYARHTLLKLSSELDSRKKYHLNQALLQHLPHQHMHPNLAMIQPQPSTLPSRAFYHCLEI